MVYTRVRNRSKVLMILAGDILVEELSAWDIGEFPFSFGSSL